MTKARFGGEGEGEVKAGRVYERKEADARSAGLRA